MYVREHGSWLNRNKGNSGTIRSLLCGPAGLRYPQSSQFMVKMDIRAPSMSTTRSFPACLSTDPIGPVEANVSSGLPCARVLTGHKA